ncbi:MAG TPA: prolipoprotein diacylglyceryl transferase [Parachlamydiaceae bacterium]|nr:prolipoprotein diacylglyceryl transferase [Parachlamydiaceae bacterium]
MNLLSALAWLFWNPPREAFTIPYFDIAVAWYGILFATGFVVGYFILIPILRTMFTETTKIYPRDGINVNTLATSFADKITWFIVIGTIVGARLGHVLFYDWPYYSANPIEILMIRKGGLASHGGTLGIMLALILFLRWNRKIFPEMTFVKLIDILVIPTAMTVCFIRLANFFNQEILGNPTNQPWGIIFGHAADGSAPIPRHPVQLYEALAYLATFIVLYLLWKVKGTSLKPGILSGLFFIFVFGSRFFIEYLKEPQSVIDSAGLHMGQYLSIPFILMGIGLLFMPERKSPPVMLN